MLVLLPTDHSKLPMQWKGPFEIRSVVGLNDYEVKVEGKKKVYHANLLQKYFEQEEITIQGAVALGAGTSSIEDAVDCAAKVDEAEGEEVDFLELGARSQSRMWQLDQILRTSNGLNLRIWLKSSRICLLKHPVPQISFSIILNLLQTSRLDQDLTQYLTA